MESDNEIDKQAFLERLSEAAESTFWGFLGCQLERIRDDKIIVSLEAKPHHLNVIGIVHGGVLSSLLDNAMGIAVMLARPQDKVVTTNLNVHFVSPLKEGKLIVTAEVVHQSRKMITTYGTVTDDAGQLGTMGTGSFRVI
jgi:uncharacterized protein (TIGR00369 family)